LRDLSEVLMVMTYFGEDSPLLSTLLYQKLQRAIRDEQFKSNLPQE